MKALKYFLFSAIALGIAVIFVVFSLQNNEQTQLHLFAYSTPLFPISGYLMVSVFLGMLFSGFIFILTLFKMKATQMSLKKQIKKLDRELQQLRNQPIESIPQNRNVEVAKLVEKEDEIRPHYIQST